MPYQLKNFDWYALKCGRKPALTLEYSEERFRAFERFLPEIQGEGFRTLVRDLAVDPPQLYGGNGNSLSSGGSRYQVFIARRRRDIDRLLKAYDSADMPGIGELLGYPSCCVEAYAARINGREKDSYPYLTIQNDLLAALAPAGRRHYVPGVNFLLHYDGRVMDRRALGDSGFRKIFFELFPYSLTDHCPCSVDCSATARRGRAVFEAIRKEDPEWAARAEELAGSPVLYLGNFNFFVLRALQAEAAAVDYSSVLFSSVTGSVASALAAGDRVSVRTGEVEIYSGGRRIFRSAGQRRMPVILPFHPWTGGRAASGPSRASVAQNRAGGLIHLFRKCNQRCVFCSYPEEGGRDEHAALKDWLKAVALMPPGLVQVSGGEPLLAPAEELCALLAAVRRFGSRAELQTNAIAAAGIPAEKLGKIVRALSAADGYFNVNFPAASARLDLLITRTPGAFRRRLAGVERLLAAGAKVRLTHVISSLNYRELPDFAAFAAKRLKRAAWIQFSYIKGTGRAEGSRFLPRYAEVRPYLEKALSICLEGGLRCDVDHVPPCFLGGFHGLSVDAAKMREGRPGPHLAEKEHVPECRSCRHLELCPGPRKDYIAVHKTL